MSLPAVSRIDTRERRRSSRVHAVAPAPDVDDAAGDLRSLPVTVLNNGARYQRARKESAIRRIVREYNPNLYFPLLVSFRADGTFWVIDGQHRLEAARRMGFERVPCIVRHDLTVQQEAYIFGESTRNRNAMHPIEKFHADIVAERPEALRLRDTVAAAGFVAAEDKNVGPGKVLAIGTLVRMVGRYTDGYDVLEQVLTLYRETWGVTNPGPSAPVLEGLATFLRRYPEAHRATLLRKLRAMTPAHLETTGKAVAKQIGLSTHHGIAYQVYRTYQERIRVHRLPAWVMPGDDE